MLEACVQTGGFFRGNDQADPRNRIKQLYEYGFESIDYNICDFIISRDIINGTPHPLLSAEMPEYLEFFRPLKEACEEFGIKFSQMHAPFPVYVKDCGKNEELLEAVIKCMAAAQYLNCPTIVVHPFTSSISKEDEWEVNMNLYRKLIPAAKQYGVMICLENMFFRRGAHLLPGCCADASEACRYIDALNEEAGEELFGYCFDIGHANLTSRLIANDIRTLGKRLTILHIHDNDSLDDLHLMPYSQSSKRAVDWEGFIQGLRDIGYRGSLSFETFNVMNHYPPELWPEVLQLMAAECRYFKDRILAE